MALLDQILGPLEIVLNRALATSPEATALLAEQREPVALYFRDLDWGLRIYPAPHGVQLMPGSSAARATLSTSLVGLARLMAGEDARTMGTALQLQGDAEYAEQIMSALRQARIDLETEITSLLGPVLGSGLGQGLSGLLAQGRQGLRTLLLGAGHDAAVSAGADAGELAAPEQVHAWMDQIDELATALDRLDARVARLERQREGT